MAVGVASANSVLLVTFAREQQLAGMSAFDAAIAAGRTRIRTVLMTAAAMIVGMIPMAIGGPGENRMRRWRAPSSAASCSRHRPPCS
jgi:multidrug efflux pump subunit AcrB